MKIFYKYNEKKKTQVKIKLDKSALSYFNKDKGGWITEYYKFKIQIGSSSDHIQLEKEIEINE